MRLFDKLFGKEEAELTLLITSTSGMHLRPAALMSNHLKSYPLRFRAGSNKGEFDPLQTGAWLMQDLDTGDEITLHISGKGASSAAQKIAEFFETLMQNDNKSETPKTKESHTEMPNYPDSAFALTPLFEGIVIAPLVTLKKQSIAPKEHISFTKAARALLNEEPSNPIEEAQRLLLQELSANTDSLEAFEVAITKVKEKLTGKMRAKAIDYDDLLQRVKSRMGYRYTLLLPKEPSIVVAKDLLPSDVKLLDNNVVKGVILTHTTPYAHSAILLKEKGVISAICDEVPQSAKVAILDTQSGVLLADPSDKSLTLAKAKQQEINAFVAEAKAKRFEPITTANGTKVTVLANVSTIHDAKVAKNSGAEGIGLLRTEFLFKEKKPSFDEQVEAYKAIFSLFDSVTVRTLDVGGDKALPYLEIAPENNPFLGRRGIRLLHTHKALIKEQLGAIFEAAKGHSGIKVMFPMVSTVGEFDAAKALAGDVAREHDIDISPIKFGIMIEVPSVLFALEAFNEAVDFYSIGTNDLTQYLYAIDRTHPSLRADTGDEALWRALRHTVHQCTKPLSICGDLAGEKEALAKLLALGITTLSVAPTRIETLKERIRHA